MNHQFDMINSSKRCFRDDLDSPLCETIISITNEDNCSSVSNFCQGLLIPESKLILLGYPNLAFRVSDSLSSARRNSLFVVMHYSNGLQSSYPCQFYKQAVSSWTLNFYLRRNRLRTLPSRYRQ